MDNRREEVHLQSLEELNVANIWRRSKVYHVERRRNAVPVKAREVKEKVHCHIIRQVSTRLPIACWLNESKEVSSIHPLKSLNLKDTRNSTSIPTFY